MRFKIQGKTYHILKELPVADPTLFKNMWLVVNSKHEELTLIQSIKQYSLYNKDKQKIASTYSITFFN